MADWQWLGVVIPRSSETAADVDHLTWNLLVWASADGSCLQSLESALHCNKCRSGWDISWLKTA